MLTRRLRKMIEWHFYEYKCDLAIYLERRGDIIESGMNVNISHINSRYNKSSPTENKAEQLEALDRQFENKRNWFCVVRNTFLTFRHTPEHDIMIELYINRAKKADIIDKFFNEGLWETTFWRWRDKWLECAYNWAKEFELL